MTRRVKSSGIPNKNGISSGLRSKKQNADFGLLLTVSMNKTTITDVVPRAFRRVVSAQGPARMLVKERSRVVFCSLTFDAVVHGFFSPPAHFVSRSSFMPCETAGLYCLVPCSDWPLSKSAGSSDPADLFWPKSETPGVSLFKNVISIRKLSPETQKKESPDGLNRANKTDFLE